MEFAKLIIMLDQFELFEARNYEKHVNMSVCMNLNEFPCNCTHTPLKTSISKLYKAVISFD